MTTSATVLTKHALAFAMEHDERIDSTKVLLHLVQSHTDALHEVLHFLGRSDASVTYSNFCVNMEEKLGHPPLASMLMDHLLQDGIVPQDIAEALIVHRPMVFITAAKFSMREYLACKKSMEHLVEGNKVSAIKELRVVYGTGLKSTKDAVDALHQALFIMGLMNHGYQRATDTPFADETVQLVKDVTYHTSDIFSWPKVI